MKNQILHIFRKDVRHHWPELLLSAAALVAYAWHATTRLNPFNEPSGAYEVLLSLLSALLPVVWVLLMIRVVHGEMLVGDRQFWVTRPYKWKKLLAAKLLFILAFVNVPLLLLQIFLLIMAAFPVSTHILGLLWLQLLWIVCVILPVVVLAAVTATTAQFILVLLGGFLYLLAAGSLVGLVPSAAVAGADWLPSHVAFLVYIGVGVAVVLWQYSRRITAGSRVLVLGAATLIPFIFAATPYSIFIARIYPPASAGQRLPVALAFDPAKPASHGRGFPEKNKVHVQIPLLVTGITEGTQVVVGGRMVTIQAPGGEQWSSGWQGSREFFLPDIPHDRTTVSIDKGFFERVKASPVDVHITYALVPGRARATTQIVAQASGFAVPGEGRCSFSPFDPNAISCVFPFKTAALLVRAKSDEISCMRRGNEKSLPQGTVLYARTLGLVTGGPADFGINPIEVRSVFFWRGDEVNDPNYLPHVCPGTPLTVYSDWEELPRYRVDLDIAGIKLADYQLVDSSQGGFGRLEGGVVVP